MEKHETDIEIDIFENALQELNQIIKKIKVSENTCINCKYRSAYGAGPRGMIVVKCRYGYEDANWDAGKFIGKFHSDSFQIINRRYSIKQRVELPRKRIAHVCEHHIEDYRYLI